MFKDLLSCIDKIKIIFFRITTVQGINIISKLFNFEIIYTPYAKNV